MTDPENELYFLQKIMEMSNNVCSVMLLVLTATCAQATRAVMNPLHPIDEQIYDNEELPELPSAVLKAELRMPPTASEVMALLAEDETRSQVNYSGSAKNPGSLPPEAPRMDCSKITMQIFQVLLQNPDTVEPEDYSCGLLNLISHFEKSNGRIRTLEASLHTATNTIKSLESSLQAEMSKMQFAVKELNETVHKESERAIKAENVIARRVLSEKSRVDMIQKNLTDIMGSSLEQLKEFEVILRRMELSLPPEGLVLEKGGTTPYDPSTILIPQLPQQQQQTQLQQSSVSEQDIQKIEVKITSLQQFIQDLSNRISQMEDGSEEHVNKGIAQIFKTYASLANDIEKETERATGEESNLKNLITSEIASVAKQIQNLQDRITEEKNRVQVIENRRTADLFEEINRAKSEETRLAQKLKEEMSKAASAFKRLEQHVDTQLNSTKTYESDLKTVTTNVTRRVVEVEEKLKEQINLERTRAISVEKTLKEQIDSEMQRAMNAESDLRIMQNDERQRARNAEKELKDAIDAETYRAKEVEFSISGRVTAETERAKQEEDQLHEDMNANMTRILTDVIKEFTRAQNAEMELSEKINQETLRATGVEQSLLENINTEHSRALTKENELLSLIKAQEDSTKVVDQFKTLIETETSRAKNVETILENQIHEEIARAKTSEENILSTMNQEISNWKILEVNLTQASSDVVKHTRELELEVRKTVMAEVARAVDAENVLKQQILAESERARGAEFSLALSQVGNYSDISNRMQNMLQDIEKDSLRLEDISLQISRNLTGDILTLAELFDDKLDDLERNENIRLKKLEDDMKKCCSGSSWRWRSPKGKSASGPAGAVINRLLQVFGATNDDDQEKTVVSSSSSKRNGSKNGRKGDNSKGRSMDGNQDYVNEEDDIQVEPNLQIQVVKGFSQHQNTSVSAPKATTVVDPVRNETVVYIHAQKVIGNSGTDDELSEQTKLHKKRLLRSSRRANSMSNASSAKSNKDSTVHVHSATSKVTSRFG